MASNGARNKQAQIVLGIDLGTTSVKVALLDRMTKQVLKTKSRATQAAVHTNHTDVGAQESEQDPDRILTALQFCVSGLAKEELLRVTGIGVGGQMHGLVLWKQGEAWSRNNHGRYHITSKVSNLYTWQDGRCSQEFLSSLPKPASHLKLASGLGCATLFWLQRNSPDKLEKYDCAGTIQDYVVAMLCGLDAPVMSVHNAASWGYFDTVAKTWNKEILCGAGFPVKLLPSCVLDPGSSAGRTQACWYGIPKDIPVGAALGDLQCSILSRLKVDEDAVLNISTSAQLAFQMHSNFVPPEMDATSAIQYFPYFSGRYLAVAASLTGGNVMATFVKTLQQWTHELGLGVPEEKIWEKIHLLGQESGETDLLMTPTIYGERHMPNQRASITNITPLNTSLGSVFSALCHGVITNLHSMMSQDFLLAAGVKQIIGSGTAIIKNSIIRREIQQQYKLPLVLCTGSEEDAAVGAALAMLL